MPLLNQANHAIWQKSWSASIVLTVFPWILEVNASKEEKRACLFSPLTPRRKETTKSFCKVLASKLDQISRERQGLLLRKMAKRWQSLLKTTAKSSFTSFLVSGASFLGREAAKRAKNSGQVPRHIRSDEGLFWKSIVTEEQLQEKLQEAVCCRFFQGGDELLQNVSSKSWLAQNENCPSPRNCVDYK